MVPPEPQHEGRAMGRRSGCRRRRAPSVALARARWLAQCESQEAEEAEERGRLAQEAEELHQATGLAPAPQLHLWMTRSRAPDRDQRKGADPLRTAEERAR